MEHHKCIMELNDNVFPVGTQYSCIVKQKYKYHQTYNITRTLVGNKIVDRSEVVGASHVGAAPTTSSFLT